MAGLVATAWQARVASLERDRAKRRFEDVRSLAHAVVFDIHDAIANLPGSTKARETLVFHALRYLDNLSKEAGGDYSLQHELAVAYGKIGDVQGRPMFPNLGRSDDALKSYRRSYELLESASAACPESLAFSRDMVVTMQRLGDLLGRMGKVEESMRMEEDAKRRVQAQRALHPDDLSHRRLRRGVRSPERLATRGGRHARGALRASRGLCDRAVLLKKPMSRPRSRNIMVGYAKVAKLLESTGRPRQRRASTTRSQDIAVEAVRDSPNNTDASRDLGIVYAWRALFLADGGEIDSALALYGRAAQIATDLAAADPSDVLQQADVAHGHFEWARST